MSIQQLVEKVESVTQSDIATVDVVDSNIVELDQVAAECSKAKNVLHWEAKRSLEQTLEDGWRFYRQSLDGR